MPKVGLDQIYIDFKINADQYTLGYDNWSGIFIMARTEKGNGFVDEIGHYLNTKIDIMKEW